MSLRPEVFSNTFSDESRYAGQAEDVHVTPEDQQLLDRFNDVFERILRVIESDRSIVSDEQTSIRGTADHKTKPVQFGSLDGSYKGALEFYIYDPTNPQYSRSIHATRYTINDADVLELADEPIRLSARNFDSRWASYAREHETAVDSLDSIEEDVQVLEWVLGTSQNPDS